MRLAEPTAGVDRLADIQGVRDLSVDGLTTRLTITGAMDELLKKLATFPVQTLTSEPPDLDEIFLSHYGGNGD